MLGSGKKPINLSSTIAAKSTAKPIATISSLNEKR